MQIELLLPEQRTVELDEAVAVAAQRLTAPPFDETVMNACDALSRRIMSDSEARRYPELLALAFWIRKTEIHRLREEFHALSRPDRILTPCGTVFHLPPRNVDTMFVYSWLLSALAGNRNVIRLSPSRSASTEILLRLFRDALNAASEPARDSTLCVCYGHEEQATSAFSALCDVRVIWGGDHTVNAVRRSPLCVHGRELTFPDRYSLAAVRVESYVGLAGPERDRLADQFFNDTFWFDQLGCSSPRLLVWCGFTDRAAAASEDFFTRVAASVRRRDYIITGANSMHKFLFSAEAVLDRRIRACRRWPELTVLTLESLAGFDRSHPGGGVFFETNLETLAALAPTLERKDQTLTTFGFDDEDLLTFIHLLNGRAVDRIVPFGQALQFGRFWDGQDLLLNFCRQIHFNNSPLVRRADAAASRQIGIPASQDKTHRR